MSNECIYYSHDAEMHAVRDRTLLSDSWTWNWSNIGFLLFAPTTGKQTRGDLARNMDEGLNTGYEAMDPMVKRLEQELGELRKNVEDHLSISGSEAIKQK